MVWKNIKGYNGRYEISNTGLIKSNYGNGRLLNLHEDRKGYLRTSLSLNGNMKTVKIHRIVAKHFIPNPESKPQVNHIDNDKLNNHVDNLEWVTNQENMDHANGNGYRDGIYVYGEDHGKSKLTENDVKHIRSKYQTGNYTQKELADIYNVTKPCIRNIVIRNTWKHVHVDGYEPPEINNILSIDEVKDIKRLLKDGSYLQKEIADMFGTTDSNISRINTGKRWGHIDI